MIIYYNRRYTSCSYTIATRSLHMDPSLILLPPARMSHMDVHQGGTGYRALTQAMPPTSTVTWAPPDVGPGAGWGWPTWTWVIQASSAQRDSALPQELAIGDVELMAVGACTPSSLCMECATARCVAEWMPTSITHLMLFGHTIKTELWQLTVHM